MIILFTGKNSEKFAEFYFEQVKDQFDRHLFIHNVDGASEAMLRNRLVERANFYEFDSSQLIVLASDSRWFLDHNDKMTRNLFETLGGVHFTENPDDYSSVIDTEVFPSFQVQSWATIGSFEEISTTKTAEYLKFILSRATYAEKRAGLIHSSVRLGYFGESVYGPRTVFVSQHEGETADFVEDVLFWDNVIEFFSKKDRYHTGIVSANLLETVQAIFPYAGYVAIGSDAYKKMTSILEEDIVRSGIPDYRGIKDWSDASRVHARFARLASNVVESGERKTSLLHL